MYIIKLDFPYEEDCPLFWLVPSEECEGLRLPFNIQYNIALTEDVLCR